MGNSQATVSATAPELKPEWSADYSNVDRSKITTTSGKAEVEILCAPAGPASEAEGWKPTTIMEVFKKCVDAKGDKLALAVEDGLIMPKTKEEVPAALPRDQWKKWTYNQYHDDVRAAAKGYIKLGVEQHDAVNIYGFNSPEWIIAEYAAIFAGGMAAGIYPSDTVEQVLFKCRHSGASLAICEDGKKFQAFADNIEECPKLKAIVSWSYEHDAKTLTRKDGSEVQCLTWAQLIELGKAEEDTALDAVIALQKPGHCCALIYTSGTTGNPKAVMISHDNILFEASACLPQITNLAKFANKPERILSYLPLSHVAGMLVDIVAPVFLGAEAASHVELYFARPYDLKFMSLKARITSVRPTIFLGVPRVWEKFAEALKAVGAKTTGIMKSVSTFAKEKGLEHQRNCQLGGTGDFPSMYGMANAVLNKVKGKIGLDECHFGFTGAAPITVDTLEYFGQLAIQINEVYGMSECTGATTWSNNEAHVWGSCGYIVPGVEVKIFDEKGGECPRADDINKAPDAAQGEVCFRGRHIMMGYLANPDLGEEHVAEITKKTEDAIDENGWLHSGDMGCLGANGMLKITGRYKELIIGAGGENIAPVPIEDMLKKLCPAVSNIIMIGDKRKYNVCLVTLKANGATGELPGTNELAGDALKVDADVKTITDAIKSEKFAKHIEDCLIATNKTAPNSASKIQKFSILPLDFSSVTGELTPTFKLKRSVTEKKWAAHIDSMFESKATYVPVNIEEEK